jgi:hypothetical protein
MNDPRARAVTYAQARLDLELFWALEGREADDQETADEWFERQSAEAKARAAANPPPPVVIDDPDVPTAAQGNADPAAALARLKALRNPKPRPDQVFEVVDLLAGDEV